MESLTYATPRCIGEAVTVSGNSAEDERQAEFRHDNFVASFCEWAGNAWSMDASASSHHAHRW
jgi:hypothetical protein